MATAAIAPQPSSGRIAVCLLCDTVAHDAGTERLVIEIARRLDHSKFDVHVCCLEDSPQLHALRDVCRTAVFPASSINSLQGVRQLADLRHYLKEHQIRVVHAFMTKTAMFGVLSCVGSSRAVVTSRLNTGYWYTQTLKLAMRAINLGTTRVLTNSAAGRRIVAEAEKLPPAEIDVWYQGVDTTKYFPGCGDPTVADSFGIPKPARVVGIVANLRPVKDLPLFLRAAKLVAEAHPDTAFLIAGRGEQLSELEQLASQLGIREKMFFTNGQGSVVDWLSRASVACLSSHSEGFSNAILEYMAMGLPVVATDVGGNGEAIVDGESGFLVGERTPEAFAAPLVRLLQDEELRIRMGRAARERCVAEFELNKTVRDLESYYARLA